MANGRLNTDRLFSHVQWFETETCVGFSLDTKIPGGMRELIYLRDVLSRRLGESGAWWSLAL